MDVVASAAEMTETVGRWQAAGETVGFVPTMGALHEGHLSLIDVARRDCRRVVASVFVNPTQFGPTEDLSRYPRPMERDLALLAERGCDAVFAPSVQEIYPAGFDSFVDVGAVARPLEGAARPHHFHGVATVVLKLLLIVPADRAYFGRKDYQQTLVVKRLVADFRLPTVICVCPLVRESDGLAMSSRNAYLDADQRRRAVSLSAALRLAETRVAAGERRTDVLRKEMQQLLADGGVTEIDYIAFLADGTVDEVARITGPTTVALAARVGSTRLIDNLLVHG
jgi:pantoate--beta-alanine ligase